MSKRCHTANAQQKTKSKPKVQPQYTEVKCSEEYILKPHLITSENRYDVYFLAYDKGKISSACNALQSLGVVGATHKTIGLCINKIILEGASAKRTIRLINTDNGIKFGAKISSKETEKLCLTEELKNDMPTDSSRVPHETNITRGENTMQDVTQAENTSNNNIKYIEELKQLKELVDLGIISQEEFDTKKKQLLGL